MLEMQKRLEIDDAHLDLVARRGRRMGFRGPDLDDAVQEAVIAIMTFEFDEERANGASLETALTAVIDRCLLSLRRKRGRYAKHLNKLLEAAGEQWTELNEPVEPNYEESTDLQLDVQTVLASLSREDRQICRHLADGRSVQQVAAVLGCDWHTAQRHIERIRDVFEKSGLKVGLADRDSEEARDVESAR